MENYFSGMSWSDVNPYRAGTEFIWFIKVDIMVAYALAPGVAWTSAIIILIMQSR